MLTSLNDDQRAFCEAQGSSVRLLAPAGCGKTHALLWRCLHLATTAGKESPRFLLFTFTRAARDELRDRLRNDPAFRPVAPLISITTLNSWGFRRLKASRHSLKLMTNRADRFFCINNVLQPVWQQHSRIRELLEDNRRRPRASQELMDLTDTLKTLGFCHRTDDSIERLEGHINWLVSSGMSLQVRSFLRRLHDLELVRDQAKPVSELLEHFVRFWREACERMFQSAIITLDDQKYWSWLDLVEQLETSRPITGAARYHHILVDEFQDINPLDLALLKSIAALNRAELTIVGDDDQAIYEWRGATPDFILQPDEYIGGSYQTFILGVNYRSPENIVALSQRLIAHNKRRVPKDVRASSSVKAQVQVVRLPGLSESIDHVLAVVKRLLSGNECSKVAIVGRKRSQIIPYQIVFARENIPFYAAEDLQLFLSDAFNELKDILAIRARADMKGIIGMDPVSDVVRLCDKVKRYPLSKKDREALRRHLLQAHPRSLIEGVRALLQYMGPLKGTNEGGRMSDSFAVAIAGLLKAGTVSEAINAISENFDGMQKDYGKSIEDIFYADPPFLHLGVYARRYGADYAAFYEDIEKAIATLARVPPEEEENNADEAWKLPLHLMTALRAKGKEFDAVIILDANDGIWPSRLAQSDEEKEQERRMFYVAMTRARKELHFLVNDSLLDEVVNPSPYLAEMGLVAN